MSKCRLELLEVGAHVKVSTRAAGGRGTCQSVDSDFLFGEWKYFP